MENNRKEITIMIVEDEAITAMDLRRMLEKIGYSVSMIVSSGEETIQNVLSNTPDLILMDIMLSDEMDGIETAKCILEKVDVPIVYLSASNDPLTIERMKTTKHYGFLMKPIDKSNLQPVISTAIERHKIEKKG